MFGTGVRKATPVRPAQQHPHSIGAFAVRASQRIKLKPDGADLKAPERAFSEAASLHPVIDISAFADRALGPASAFGRRAEAELPYTDGRERIWRGWQFGVEVLEAIEPPGVARNRFELCAGKSMKAELVGNLLKHRQPADPLSGDIQIPGHFTIRQSDLMNRALHPTAKVCLLCANFEGGLRGALDIERDVPAPAARFMGLQFKQVGDDAVTTVTFLKDVSDGVRRVIKLRAPESGRRRIKSCVAFQFCQADTERDIAGTPEQVGMFDQQVKSPVFYHGGAPDEHIGLRDRETGIAQRFFTDIGGGGQALDLAGDRFGFMPGILARSGTQMRGKLPYELSGPKAVWIEGRKTGAVAKPGESRGRKPVNQVLQRGIHWSPRALVWGRIGTQGHVTIRSATNLSG